MMDPSNSILEDGRSGEGYNSITMLDGPGQNRTGVTEDYVSAPYTSLTQMTDAPAEPATSAGASQVNRKREMQLYTSHFLSTWNSRLFEFGATIFLAAVFPGTLRPMSIYALVRSASAILFARSIGSWIDRGNRLTVVRVSIIGQRVAVAVSCAILWVMERQVGRMSSSLTNGLFAVLSLLACVEKLCAMGNLVSVERDWVVVMAEGDEGLRRALNARMRRIDLLCKLLGPLAISLIAMASTIVAIWATLGMNIVSVLFEYVCIERVYKSIPALRRPPPATRSDSRSTETVPSASWLISTTYRVLPINTLPFYVRHPAFLPSFSLSLLYLTVLSFSGQMITFLISIGYTPLYVGIARTISTILELSATWIAPRLMQRIGTVRSGIWSLSWQMIWLAGGTSWLFTNLDGSAKDRLVSATGLAVCTALSRVGLWGYDLSAQMIVQDEVEAEYRGSFSAVEAAFQNLFELLSFTTTIVFSHPDQFQWPALTSVVAVYVAGGLYAFFVRTRRGHLFHAPPCIECKK